MTVTLQVLKAEASENSFAPTKAVEILSGFSFTEPTQTESLPDSTTQAKSLSPDRPVPAALAAATMESQSNLSAAARQQNLFAGPPPEQLTTPEIQASLTGDMSTFLASDETRRNYAAYRFDRHVGSSGGGPFNDAITLRGAMIPVQWPKRIEFHMVSWGSDIIVRLVKVIYDQTQLSHGSEGTIHSSISLDLTSGEQIVRLRLGKGLLTWGVEGVAFVELSTSTGQTAKIGDEDGKEVVDYHPYGGCTGLKGFHGGSGDVIDRLGPIWGFP